MTEDLPEQRTERVSGSLRSHHHKSTILSATADELKDFSRRSLSRRSLSRSSVPLNNSAYG